MDSTRVSHNLGDPKIRQVGFFVPESSTTDSHKILSPSHLPVPEMQNSVHGQVTSRSYDPSENRNLETGIEKREDEEIEVIKSRSKPLKEKTTKAERRALQEAQRAAKAASSNVEGSKAVAGTGRAALGKSTKQSSQKKAGPSSPVAADKKAGDRPSDKDRKKDAPHPRLQFDDESRMEKARRRAVVNPTESRTRVELFQHLPQYEHGTKLSSLESKFFHLDLVHPSVFEVGLRYSAGEISGGNARCIAMLRALQDAIRDYCTDHEKALVRNLTAKINSYVSFFAECRPLSMSMGNAIR